MSRSRTTLRLASTAIGIALIAATFDAVDTRDLVAAEVVHGAGFRATVDGWDSWYGNYSMGSIGLAWCVDHGAAAPDPDLDYQLTDLPGVDTSTKTAMAWAAGTYGRSSSRVDAAALMLVLHDLMGARYPSGQLDVDALSPARLSGFEGNEASVVSRAKAIKADAIGHSRLRGDLRLSVSTTVTTLGRDGVATVRVVDGQGLGVRGVRVSLAATGARLGATTLVTGTGGRATTAITPTAVDGALRASAVAPDLRLRALAPTAAPAQRVAQPATRSLAASTAFRAARPTGELEILKRGDATPLFPVRGARFEIRPIGGGTPVGVTIGATGRARVRLPVGEHRVVETAPPAGYAAAGPWRVRITEGRLTRLEVLDRIRRGRLVLRKIDEVTGQPVAGAVLSVRRDSDGNGSFDTVVRDVTSTTSAVTLTNLLPGRHQIVETRVPPGYTAPTAPTVVRIDPGATVSADIGNAPVTTVRFRKVPAPGPRPRVVDFTGAVFAVRDGDREIGRCTTGPEGSCSLAEGSLRGGRRYCWDEVQAPAGWITAAGDCFDAGAAGSTHEVEVVERPELVTVSGRKMAGDTGAPLAGATYDLYRVLEAGADAPAPAAATPAGAERDGMAWVARAVSGDDGALDFGLQSPGVRYCAAEVEAPAGYERDDEARCHDVDRGASVLPDLVDQPVAVAPPPTTTTTAAPPRTTAPTVPITPAPPAVPSLPRTGTNTAALAAFGLGLVLVGAGLLPVSRWRPRRGAR